MIAVGAASVGTVVGVVWKVLLERQRRDRLNSILHKTGGDVKQ
jgi:hypothetical protein